MKNTILLAVALVASVAAFAQETIPAIGMDNTLEVFVSYKVDGENKHIIFEMYSKKDTLTLSDDVVLKLKDTDYSIVFNYNGLTLKGQAMMLKLKEEEVEDLKEGGLDFFEVLGVRYFFDEDNDKFIKFAKRKFL